MKRMQDNYLSSEEVGRPKRWKLMTSDQKCIFFPTTLMNNWIFVYFTALACAVVGLCGWCVWRFFRKKRPKEKKKSKDEKVK